MQIQKLAVLIDADNSSPKKIPIVLQEIAKYGIASVKRIYGDWSSEHLSVWREVLLPHAITPVQQFAYTKGKDATDMMLIINAMDLLYSGALDGFCIVSSDSDFTPLASRIRESGLSVYGFGEKKTPSAFINACDKFIYIENLDNGQDKNDLKVDACDNKSTDTLSTTENTPSYQHPNSTKITAQPNQQVQVDNTTINLIYKAIKDIADEDGWANLADLGKHLAVLKPDFDTRSYGRAKLSGLLEALGLFDIKHENSQKFVRKKSSFIKVLKIAQDILGRAGANRWFYIHHLAKRIELQYPEFNPKSFGFKTTEDAIRAINNRNFEFNEDKTQIRLLSIEE